MITPPVRKANRCSVTHRPGFKPGFSQSRTCCLTGAGLDPRSHGTPSDSTATLFDAPSALKTSNGGAVSATLSMEAALWTYNLTNAIVNGGKASSSSSAAIKARMVEEQQNWGQ